MISHYDAYERIKQVEQCDHNGDTEERDGILLCEDCTGFVGYA